MGRHILYYVLNLHYIKTCFSLITYMSGRTIVGEHIKFGMQKQNKTTLTLSQEWENLYNCYCTMNFALMTIPSASEGRSGREGRLGRD